MFSATAGVHVGVADLDDVQAHLLADQLLHSETILLVCSPPLPMTMPGRAQWRKMVTTSLLRSISILEHRPYRVFFRYLRIF